MDSSWNFRIPHTSIGLCNYCRLRSEIKSNCFIRGTLPRLFLNCRLTSNSHTVILSLSFPYSLNMWMLPRETLSRILGHLSEGSSVYWDKPIGTLYCNFPYRDVYYVTLSSHTANNLFSRTWITFLAKWRLYFSSFSFVTTPLQTSKAIVAIYRGKNASKCKSVAIE